MTFDEYVDRLFTALHLERTESFERSDDLYETVGLDSLQAFELVLFTEEIAGLSAPPSEIPMIFTLGDAYSYYESARAMSKTDIIP